MAAAIALLHGLKAKMQGGVEYQQNCRTLQLDIPAPTSVDIEFTNLSLQITTGLIHKQKKTILKNVSGHFRSGELTAIMGPSGAGKSSLLNALTGFSTKGVTGTIRAGTHVCHFGGKQGSLRSLQEYRKDSCYILQDDQLNPLFTVAELMKFAADLKLGQTLTEKLKNTVIHEILETLGLTGTESTRCSNLSGGQKKRLSIAVELIDNPPVVFLDEPTTGLDSSTSVQCIELLKTLARNGRTIVCTVHQPSASLYSLFDQVYVLADGLCVFNGSSSNTVPYLSSLGLHCPKYHNPADYMLEIANGEYGDLKDALSKACRVSEWRKLPAPASPPNGKQFSYGKATVAITPPNEFYKFRILFRRSFIQQYRDWTMTHLKVVLHALIGVLLGLLFVGAGVDGSKTVNNLGFLLVCTVYLCYTSIMPAVLRFPQELPVIKKENFNNWYNLKTYYIAVLATTIPIQIWFSVVYSLPSYFLTEQPAELSRFAMFVLVLTCDTLLSDAVGNVIGTCTDPINGTFIGAILSAAMIAFAGFLVLLGHMMPVMRLLSHASFLRHVLEGLVLALYDYDRTPLDCNGDFCFLKHPKEILKTFSYTKNNYWYDVMILVVEMVVIRFLAYWTLRRTVKKSS